MIRDPTQHEVSGIAFSSSTLVSSSVSLTTNSVVLSNSVIQNPGTEWGF